MRLDGRTAIITGAGQGIGRAIAERFAAEGASVVIAEIDEANGSAVAESIRGRRQVAHFHRCDVTREDEVRATAEFALAEFGRIDVLVNNAVWGGDWVNGNSWMSIEVALGGTWRCTQAVLPAMVERGSGAIVNISSVQALMGFGADHLYTAAKGAIVSLTRSLACEYGKHGIRVDALCPGTTDTENWNERRAATTACAGRDCPALPARACRKALGDRRRGAFLASDEASFITGAVLVVDGGITSGHVAFQEE